MTDLNIDILAGINQGTGDPVYGFWYWQWDYLGNDAGGVDVLADLQVDDDFVLKIPRTVASNFGIVADIRASASWIYSVSETGRLDAVLTLDAATGNVWVTAPDVGILGEISGSWLYQTTDTTTPTTSDPSPRFAFVFKVPKMQDDFRPVPLNFGRKEQD